jgi:hypothetical protein
VLCEARQAGVLARCGGAWWETEELDGALEAAAQGAQGGGAGDEEDEEREEREWEDEAVGLLAGLGDMRVEEG